jgi:hypothetical protein
VVPALTSPQSPASFCSRGSLSGDVGASLVPLVALAAGLLLVRNSEPTRAGVVHDI